MFLLSGSRKPCLAGVVGGGISQLPGRRSFYKNCIAGGVDNRVWPLYDGLGSERTVTNSSQMVTATLTLSAFGQTVASTGSSTSAYQFGATSGYRTEDDAGLTLVGCRFYEAQVGRFITRDTYLD